MFCDPKPVIRSDPAGPPSPPTRDAQLQSVHRDDPGFLMFCISDNSGVLLNCTAQSSVIPALSAATRKCETDSLAVNPAQKSDNLATIQSQHTEIIIG